MKKYQLYSNRATGVALLIASLLFSLSLAASKASKMDSTFAEFVEGLSEAHVSTRALNKRRGKSAPVGTPLKNSVKDPILWSW